MLGRKTLKPLEIDIQGLLIQYMAQRGIGPLDFVHIPAVSYAPASKSKATAGIIYRAIGGLPDLTIYQRDKEGKIRVLFLELKREGGKVREAQKIRAKHWPETKICFGFDEAKKAVDDFLEEIRK